MIKKFINKIRTDALTKGAIFFTVFNFFGAFLNYLVHPILARRLSISQYGDYQLLASLMILFGLIAGLLLSSVTKEISTFKAGNELDKIESYRAHLSKKLFVFGLFIFFLIIAISAPIQKIFNISCLACIVICGAQYLYNYVLILNRGIISGLQEFKSLAVNTFLDPVFKILAVLIFVWFFNFQLFGASIALGLTGLAAFIFSYAQIRKFNLPTGKKHGHNFDFIFKYSFLALSFILANQIFFNLDMLFVKASLSAEEAGLYGSLLTVGRIIYFIGGAIPMVMFPMIAEQCERLSLQKYKTLAKSLLLMALIIAPVAAFMSLFPEFTIKILVGEKFISIKSFLPLYTIPMVLLVILSVLDKYFLAIGDKIAAGLLIIGGLTEMVFLYFNKSSIEGVIMSLIISFSLVIFMLVVRLIFCYKSDKIHLQKLKDSI